jgi:hypothetical protein
LNDHILNAIDEEIAKLREARDLLAENIGAPRAKAAKTSAKSRRTLSPKARRAIADAQRKRWAKVRSQKTAATAPAKAAKKESATG